MLTNAKQFFTWWTAELKTWFTTKFAPLATEANVNAKTSAITSAISDARGDSSTTLRSISQKVDSVKSKTDTIEGLAKESNATANKNAILSAIPSIPTDYAKESNATANRTTLANAISGLQGSNTSATLTAIYTIIGAITSGLTDSDKTWLLQQFAAIDLSSVTSRLDNGTYGLQALKTLISAIPTTQISGYATEVNATANKNEIKTYIGAEGTQAQIDAMFTTQSTNISANGTYDITSYDQAIVNVPSSPQPSPTYDITEIHQDYLKVPYLDEEHGGLPVEDIVNIVLHDFLNEGYAANGIIIHSIYSTNQEEEIISTDYSTIHGYSDYTLEYYIEQLEEYWNDELGYLFVRFCTQDTRPIDLQMTDEEWFASYSLGINMFDKESFIDAFNGYNASIVTSKEVIEE